MRVIASAEAIAFVLERGGRAFVWPLELEGPSLGHGVFALEVATESPGAGHEFVRFAGEEIDILFDTSEHGLPEDLHLAVKGWRRKHLCAYWNGHSYGRE
jgi:hypothetical protein